MDALARLFCSPARLKLLRLFIFNDTANYSGSDVAFRAKISSAVARKELAALMAAGVIRRRGEGRGVKYSTNNRFPHLEPLAAFLRETTVVGPQEVLAALRKAGTLRLVVLTGLFSGAVEPKIDLLVVGDRLDERILAGAVHAIEADIGREIRYTIFSTEDFRYRFGVYDRLLRDIFDYKHRVILDKIGL
ncbi:MAG: hypothetical protein B7X04_00335 [Parcubacteria group bacterium 21-54-25]|nr:MAG: hypothetical protein B7X04_00335 [Parcubacteria group bacterium 21-54-25]HQU07494.1 winged helix-turn-helix domain-containing protein [Candidatus Paceibacterota bacterium]